jgi:prepilin-type N-terminal cleavage/methylation domain-containing protein
MRDFLPAVLSRMAKQQRGFTLIETLVAASLMTVLLGAVLSMSATSQKIAPKDQERAYGLQDAQTGLYSMTRELRQSYGINAITATQMDVNVRKGGVAKRVVYDCNQTSAKVATMKQCSRWEVVGGIAGTKVPVVPIISSATFTYTPSSGTPTFVQVKINIPAKGELKIGDRHTLVLDDGFYMRNLDLV